MRSKKYLGWLFIIGVVLFSGCTSIHVDKGRGITLPVYSRIAVGPIANYSDTPLANKQVESMVLSILHTRGFQNATLYPNKQDCAKLLYCPNALPHKSAMLAVARRQGASYILTGSTNEWRYKVGLDGEPVTGVTLNLIDVHNGHTVWNAFGSAVGSSRTGLDVVGQQMLQKMLGGLVPISFAKK